MGTAGNFANLIQQLGMDLLPLLRIVAIILAAWVIERLLIFTLRRAYRRPGKKAPEEYTRYRFLRNGVRTMMVLVVITAIIYSIPALRSLTFTLFAGAGILAVVLGFAAQKALSDIISGFFIVAFKPFRVGDMIQAGEAGLFGQVEDINLRHTTILTFENRRLVIPNSILSDDRIINSSIRDERTCEFIEFMVPQEADLNLAMDLMREQAIQHPDRINSPDVVNMEIPGEPITVRVVRIHEGAVTLRMYVWAKDPIIARRMHYDLNQTVLEAFRENDIQMFLPIRRSLQEPTPPAPNG